MWPQQVSSLAFLNGPLPCLTPYNQKIKCVSSLLNKTFPSFLPSSDHKNSTECQVFSNPGLYSCYNILSYTLNSKSQTTILKCISNYLIILPHCTALSCLLLFSFEFVCGDILTAL